MFLNKFLRKSQEELEAANQLSLQEINNTVEIPKEGSFFKKVLAYSGPGALVAVGYMDPGNWITSIAGGAQYAYSLLFVILISNLIAMLLQSMSVRLGIVTGMDLAQATRKHTGKKLGFVLWITTDYLSNICSHNRKFGNNPKYKSQFFSGMFSSCLS